jgi:membrane associated rhomboid family serine protease
MPPVTKFLLWANIVIFVIDWLFLREAIAGLAAFKVSSAFGRGHLWELITFQFIHGNPGHIVFNSFGLYFFGPWLERWWGSRRFTVFYLLCGAAGALFYTLLGSLGIVASGGSLVGASAGIYGCLIGAAVIDPKAQVQLLFVPVPLTIRKVALILMGIAVVVIIGGMMSGDRMFDNAGGQAGHLGGAVLGYLLVRFPQLLRKGEKAPAGKVVHPKEFKRKRRHKPKLGPRSHVDTATASEVDSILDKINREGIQSLTVKEQQILSEAGKTRKDR